MKTLIEKAGASFLRAFVASIVILVPGVLAAPNLNQSYALGVAALIASVTAGTKALQVFVPQLSFYSLVNPNYAKYLDSFARAFIGTFLTLVIGVLNAPDLGTAKSLLVAALVGAVAAGVRALQAFFTAGEEPSPSTGI